MDFLNLPGLEGWPSTIFTIILLLVGLIYINKSAQSKAKTLAEEAQKSAIEAMQAEINVLRDRMEDERKENEQKMLSLQKENTRLERIIDTICMALKQKGYIISISGEMINIEIEDPKRVTTVRIQDTKDATV